MMKHWRWLGLSLFVALLAASVATWWLLRHVQDLQEQQYEVVAQYALNQARVPVVVASVELSAGMLIEGELLRVRELDAASIPADSIHPADIQPYLGRTIGAHVQQAIPAGTPLQLLHLAPQLNPGKTDTEETKGLVVFSFAISWLESHGGMIQLADRVDLFQKKQGFAELVFSRAKVVALGEQHGLRMAGLPPTAITTHSIPAISEQQRHMPYQQVSVLVPLSKVAKLNAIADQGRLFPILRFNDDSAQPTRLSQGYSQDIIVPGGRL